MGAVVEGMPPGHDVVTNPTCPQPGFTLPRRQFVTLNRLRCCQARCAESLYRWGVIASTACTCGERATRPQGTLLKSAHSLHSLEACDVYTKRVPMQWTCYRDCLCESSKRTTTTTTTTVSRVIWNAFLRLYANFPPVLIPNSPMYASRITESVYKLKVCCIRIQPCLTPLSQYWVNYCCVRSIYNENWLGNARCFHAVERRDVLEIVK